MSVQDVLTAYGQLKAGYARVDELKKRAEGSPNLYREADEMEADLNESARGLLAQVCELLPGGQVWTVVVKHAYNGTITTEVFRSEGDAYGALSFDYPVDGVLSNSELVAEIEASYGHSVCVGVHVV